MVHLFLVSSVAEDEISLIQFRLATSTTTSTAGQRLLTPPPASPLACSTGPKDNDAYAIQVAKAGFGSDILGCGDVESLCNTPGYMDTIRPICPETCGVPCHSECPKVSHCDWGMLTTVGRMNMSGIECDEVTCTPISEETLEECPWMVGTSGLDNTFQCGDGSTCNAESGLLVQPEHFDTYEWDCCNNRQKRSKCPNNYPYMCNDPCSSCLTGVNFTCHKVSCNAHGGYRTCEKAESEQRIADEEANAE